MGKRLFSLMLVVGLGVLSGVLIIGAQMKDKSLKHFVNKQETVLQVQNRIEKKLGTISQGLNVKDLEQRIEALEKQVKALTQEKGAARVQAGPPAEDFSKVYQIDVAHSPIIGAKEAPVTFVEFVDFQCPYCARFHQPLVEAAKDFPGKVRFIVKNFPLSFHPQARPAAKAAFAAAQQGKYGEMVEILLANGRTLNEDKFKEFAQQLELDVAQFEKDYKDKDAQWEEYIRKDIALGSKVGVRGTPTFFVNGRKTRARDVEGFKQEIQKVLSEQ